MLRSLRRFSRDEVAKERLRIIEFYDTYGEKAAKKAFGVNRKTIFVWKRRLKKNKNSISSLIPISTTPKAKRTMTTDPRVVSYIRFLRQKYPRLGKEKIKPLLDTYCSEEELSSIEVSTTGKVIRRNNLFFQKQGRVYHNPNSGFAKHKRTRRQRVRYAPKPAELGYVEMDTVLRFIDGVRYYFYQVIGVRVSLLSL